MIVPVLLISNYKEIADNERAEDYLKRDIEKEYVVKKLYISRDMIKYALEIDVPNSPVQPVHQIFVETEGGNPEVYDACGSEIARVINEMFKDN